MPQAKMAAPGGTRSFSGAFPAARSGRSRYRPRPRTALYGVAARRVAASLAAAQRAALPGQELKFHDVDVDQAVGDQSAGVILNTSSINFIPQGVTDKTRIGRKCTIKSIGWRGQLQLAASATSTLGAPISVRLMLVQDKQCSGLVPTVTGVLESANYQSFNNLSNKGRFRTLYDKTFPLNTQAGAGDGTTDDSPAMNVDFSFFKDCNIVLEIADENTPPVIADIRTNNLFVLMINSTTGSRASLDSKIRLRFSDG